jgi:hypothetical protein
LFKHVTIAAAFCLIGGVANAADLAAVTAQCLASPDSKILSLKRPALIKTLTQYRDDAKSTSLDKKVIFSSSATFDWAMSTTIQCNVALGYLQNGFLDKDSAQKCDCFHGHLAGLL